MSEEERLDILRRWRIRDNMELILETWLAIRRQKKELNLKTEEINNLLEDLQNPALSGASGDSKDYTRLISLLTDVTLQKRYKQEIADRVIALRLLRKRLMKLIKKTNADINILCAEKTVGHEHLDENRNADEKPSSDDTCVGEFHDVDENEFGIKSGLKSKIISVIRSLAKSKDKVKDENLPYYVDKIPSLESLLLGPEDALYSMQDDHVTGDNVTDFQGDLIKL
ncbi:uncharacterized protein LOC121389534 [Gigantopelta aegis]|uniref:uncharacterized protein LOC121389534 n=1 Tax=Gigantopelta aegis TaxID=1735272 RepID=UPI001B887D3E|nr:uncharacterized protein LOC121389534 [Gigantopelta aegis]